VAQLCVLRRGHFLRAGVGLCQRPLHVGLAAQQPDVADQHVAQLDAAQAFRTRIATTIEADKPFYAAEAYHQDYLTLHPDQPYIAINDLPKIAELKRLFPDRYRETPVLVRAAGR
jgi:peptide-methionine (S)-S-oxide reductase